MPQVGKYVRQGAQMGCALLTMLILAIAGLMVFGPPTRRQLLLSHLREPMWPVPPSRRARLHWRLAELALADAGIHRKPGDSARDVALRAVDRYPGVNLEALVSAAEIADRVAYVEDLSFLVRGDVETVPQAAFRWVLDNPHVSLVLSGAKNTRELRDAVAASEAVDGRRGGRIAGEDRACEAE